MSGFEYFLSYLESYTVGLHGSTFLDRKLKNEWTTGPQNFPVMITPCSGTRQIDKHLHSVVGAAHETIVSDDKGV